MNEQYRQAREWMDQGRFEEAIILFQRNVQEDPHFKDLELWGECLIHLERLKEAIVPLAAATTLNRGTRAPCLLAEVFFSLGEMDKSLQMTKFVLSRDPKHRRALKLQQQIANVYSPQE